MKDRPAPIDQQIFWPSLICVVAVILLLIAFPRESDELLPAVKNFTTHQFGFLYLWFTAAAFAVLLWLAFGRYGRVKLGDADDRPEHRELDRHALLRRDWHAPAVLGDHRVGLLLPGPAFRYRRRVGESGRPCTAIALSVGSLFKWLKEDRAGARRPS